MSTIQEELILRYRDEKLIKQCPVCKSNNIVQDEYDGGGFVLDARQGSHCGDCGVQFSFNHTSYEEFDKEHKR